MSRAQCVTVRTLSRRGRQGLATFGAAAVRCSLGRSGTSARKREGDGATPIGSWRMVEVLYRPDRVSRPRTGLPLRALRRDHGWCDQVGDRNYNRPVRHPYPASAEQLWRQDHVYDVVVVLSHNRVPRVQGGGSAVFMHLARPGYAPTEGCVAFAERDMRLLLANADRRTRLLVIA